MFPNLYRIMLAKLLDITEQEAQDLHLGSAQFYRLGVAAKEWILQQSIGDPLRSEMTRARAEDQEAAAVIVLAMKMSTSSGIDWPWREAIKNPTFDDIPF